MGGGSWPRGGKKRKTRPDIARRREKQRDWGSCNRTRKRRILRSDTHWPSRRVVGILNPCTDARRTETTCVTPTCVAPSISFFGLATNALNVRNNNNNNNWGYISCDFTILATGKRTYSSKKIQQKYGLRLFYSSSR